MNKKMLALLIILPALLALSGCKKSTVTYTVDGPDSVAAGKSITLMVLGSDDTMPDITTWSSSDETLATVDADGVVTGKSAGSVSITATFPQGTANAVITVTNRVETIYLSGLARLANDERATYLALASLTGASWSSSDEALLSSQGDGVFLAKAPGLVTITCEGTTAQGESARGTMEVTVDAARAIIIPSDALTVNTNHAASLGVSTNFVSPVTYASSDESVATVSDNGVVSGIAPGTVTITVTSQDLTREITVTVADLTYPVTIDGLVHQAQEGTSLSDLLCSLYGRARHASREGFGFVGWYRDESFTTEAVLTREITSACTLHSRYESLVITNASIPLDAVLIDGSAYNENADVTVLTADWSSTTGTFPSGHALYVVRYDSCQCAYVLRAITSSVNAVAIPQDGFVIAVKSTAKKASLYAYDLTLGSVLTLDSYTIVKATKLTLNPTSTKKASSVTMDSSSLLAEADAIYDPQNDAILYSKNGTLKEYPASMTKLMTALTALRFASLADTITVGDELDLTFDAPYPSLAGLAKGETWTLRELLYALFLPSGNDAAYEVAALAIKSLHQGSGKTAREKIDLFASYMNETAAMMGLVNSRFAVPDGNDYYLSDGFSPEERTLNNYSCVEDMVRIGSYALAHPALSIVMDTLTKTIVKGTETYSWTNTNGLVQTDNSIYVGCKTGTADFAGMCITGARYKNSTLVIICVMHADTNDKRYTDAWSLFAAYDAAQG